ncbi:uncharacterized protein LOC144068552 [Stigmatopora argus]
MAVRENDCTRSRTTPACMAVRKNDSQLGCEPHLPRWQSGKMTLHRESNPTWPHGSQVNKPLHHEWPHITLSLLESVNYTRLCLFKGKIIPKWDLNPTCPHDSQVFNRMI